jgi:YesN/AraC family two-component response regulator
MNDLDNIIPSVNYFVKRCGTPDWRIIKDKIKFHELSYVYRGQATFIINNYKYNVQAGDLIYIPSGLYREAYSNNDNTLKMYSFNFNCFDYNNQNIKLPLSIINHIGLYDELINLFNSFSNIWNEQSPGFKLKSRAVFTDIIHTILTMIFYKGQSINSDDRIKRVKKYMLDNYNEDIQIKKLSDKVDLHPVYLGALFKKETGITIKEYITKIRINYAENLLSMENASVSKVAIQCGFDDIYYFSKVFKKYKGFPPSFIKKTIQQN